MNRAWFFIRYSWLTGKRLLRRKLYLAMLVSVFLTAFAFGRISSGSGAVVTVAVAGQGKEDGFPKEAAERLAEDGFFTVVLCADEAEAVQEVDSGHADAAWIFAENSREKLREFAGTENFREPVITVYEREDTPALRLSREKLVCLLYPELSFDLFDSFVTRRLRKAGAAIPGEEELRSYYQAGITSGSIVEHRYANAGGSGNDVPGGDRLEAEKNGTGGSYLLAPVRGMIAVIIFLSMLASAMYCREDRESGLTAVLPGQGGKALVFAYLFPAGLLSSGIALASLYAAGVAGAPGREVLCLLLYLLITAGFCAAVYLLLPKSGRIAAALPFLVILMLLQCPIFFDIPSLQPLRFIFPPYYYLRLAGL